MAESNLLYNKKKNALLVFSDGSIVSGYSIGKRGITKGEICFNTSITGYQEVITDPSYCGQIITFTFPHIGNVGVNENDIESRKIHCAGLIIREAITNPSNYRSKENLDKWLNDNGIVGICGVDTRKITQLVRKNGAKTVSIISQENIDEEQLQKVIQEISKFSDLTGVELALKVTNRVNIGSNEGKWIKSKDCYKHNENIGSPTVVAIDFGIKLNILRCLNEIGFNVVTVPADASLEKILSYNPYGIFLSNGPGDPEETAKYASNTIKSLIEKGLPIFGICLGHQLLALAMGAKTIKMHQGHRGANHPVHNLLSNKVEITSQNHGFCVDKESIPANCEITHISLFDGSVEGIKLKDKSVFSVQHHPESSPGPNDSLYLFETFYDMVKAYKDSKDNII